MTQQAGLACTQGPRCQCLCVCRLCFGLFWAYKKHYILMWPLLDSLVAIDQLDPFFFQAFQTLSISITLLWQKLNFLWCIFMYPKCCSVLTGSIAFPVVWWCKNTLGLNRRKRNGFYFNVCIDFHIFFPKCFPHKALALPSKHHLHGPLAIVERLFQNLTRAHKNTQRTNFIIALTPCCASVLLVSKRLPSIWL